MSLDIIIKLVLQGNIDKPEIVVSTVGRLLLLSKTDVQYRKETSAL